MKYILSIVFGCLVISGCTYDNTVVTQSTTNDVQHVSMSSSFNDEIYIWESWRPTTNRVERFNANDKR